MTGSLALSGSNLQVSGGKRTRANYYGITLMNIESGNFTVNARERDYKAQLGQFMTSPVVANFMASLLVKGSIAKPRVLDAGAGTGILASALLESWRREGEALSSVQISAYEIDTSLIPILRKNLSKYSGVMTTISADDYIDQSVNKSVASRYTHAILNPPYKKISSQSKHRKLLRTVGIETGNLYSAFVALALREMVDGGQLVAIIPRSFCNGPYFKPFRKFILNNAALTHIHLFNSRTDAFKADKVLQENIIIRLERGAIQSEVVVSTSNDASFSDFNEQTHPFEQIVQRADKDQFIHIPTQSAVQNCEVLGSLPNNLEGVGISVSTGPVVGFRLKEHLRDQIDHECVPLIYPTHFRHGKAQWPLMDGKKPNAIHKNSDTQKWLYPNGFYCVVRRFSSKEERHRIVASVVEPEVFGSAEFLGLDNKLNIFHENKCGLTKELAHGLAAFLNTDFVDNNFRLFSGHTQVNATDLRRMKYPRKETLEELGSLIIEQGKVPQDQIYNKLGI